MPGIDPLLQQAFQQYGLLGLVIVFLLLGPVYTHFRTRAIRTQAETNAHTLVSEFAQKERLRSERLEERLNETFEKLNAAEEEVAQLRLRLAKAQNDLDEMPKLKHRIRVLAKRVIELEQLVESQRVENEQLQSKFQQQERESQCNAQQRAAQEAATRSEVTPREPNPEMP